MQMNVIGVLVSFGFAACGRESRAMSGDDDKPGRHESSGAISRRESPARRASGRGSKEMMRKVELDLDLLDERGLRGAADGKVAVSYEFAIPDTEAHRREVREIDPSVRFMPGSRGRVGAGEDACLCIGSTHQAGHREVLHSLAALPYVERIIECHYE